MRLRASVQCRASAGVPQRYGYGPSANRPEPWQVVAGVCAVAMLLCNFHRSTFTALLPLLAGGLGLAPAEVGLLQSAMLWGYLLGQIPAGKLADERGGDRVLLAGLGLWSVATAATASAAAATSAAAAVLAVAAARVAMGLFSAVVMPSVSAVTAQWVPADCKAATLAMIYAFFNLGGVIGLIVAPHLATRSGWPSAFITAAAGGVMWAVLGSAVVARAGLRPLPPAARLPAAAATAVRPEAGPGGAAETAAAAVQQPQPHQPSPLPAKRTGGDAASAAAQASSEPSGQGGSPYVQLAALCWCHCVIGWGFFVLQAWIPLYLQSLGVASLADAGLLASLPWLAAAFTATIAAGFADKLVRSGRTTRLNVRRGMHAVSTLGCAVSLLPLAVVPAGAALPPLAVTACLVGAVGCYGFSFGGFHAYVQDVATADAGKVLGLTNTAATLGGIVGNLATGWLLQTTGGYGGVFAAAVALYCSSWLCFTGLLRGELLSLRGRLPGLA